MHSLIFALIIVLLVIYIYLYVLNVAETLSVVRQYYPLNGFYMLKPLFNTTEFYFTPLIFAYLQGTTEKIPKNISIGFYENFTFKTDKIFTIPLISENVYKLIDPTRPDIYIEYNFKNNTIKLPTTVMENGVITNKVLPFSLVNKFNYYDPNAQTMMQTFKINTYANMKK